MPTDLLGRDYETFPAPEPLQTHGPARVIAMCNQKGGVGKTTSSINIAGALSQYGRRCLIVDFDPQGAATVGLGINANAVENTVYTALFDSSIDPHEIVQHTDFENLDIMPRTSTCPPPRCSWSPKSVASRSSPACCKSSAANTT